MSTMHGRGDEGSAIIGAERPQLVSSCPIASQLLPFQVLRQPLEFTQYASGDYQALPLRTGSSAA
jgi:hypothetical protein